MPGTLHSCARVLSVTIANHTQLDALGNWVDKLPNAHKACLAICLKGIPCNHPRTKHAIQTIQNVTLHSCVHEPGGHQHGHEGVCVFRFLIENYHKPWQNVFFLHGDIQLPKHNFSRYYFEEFLQNDEWPPWPNSIEQMDKKYCGCGPRPWESFGPRDFWYKSITWWLGNFITFSNHADAVSIEQWLKAAACTKGGYCKRSGIGAYPFHMGALKFPLGYMFHVDRETALRRSQPWLRAQYQMCKSGVRVLGDGVKALPIGQRSYGSGFSYYPMTWGHVNERLAFWQFGRDFEERPVPLCVIEGGGELSMNCSQPTITLPDDKMTVRTSRWSSHWAHSRVRWGCPPYSVQCGKGCPPYSTQCGRTLHKKHKKRVILE